MKPIFSKRMRDGKLSLWVNGYNIWDLPPKQATDDVLKAIQSAFDRGSQLTRNAIIESSPNATHSVGDKWEDDAK